ncbi:hypothetical protein ACFWNK_37570 [Streptomyces sp. NPDC058417]|uniref:hypothetical protein n=1 Tax=unclassified Streptomyces TaxID=2593676 RepID=UPI003648E813
MPLMNKRYLLDLARYRWLLASPARIPGERAESLVCWWNTLTPVMTEYHRSTYEILGNLLPRAAPKAGAVLAALATRHRMLAASRGDAGRLLADALGSDRPSFGAALLSFIRFQEEMTATVFWEEREVLPLALRSLPPAEWRRVESSVLASQANRDSLGFVLPWVCETLPPKRRAQILSAFSVSVRDAFEACWVPEYDRFAARTWPPSRTSAEGPVESAPSAT